MRPLPLTLFDLDHTLLDGDSDVLWCEFLMARGVLDREAFEPQNQRMERDYKAGTVSPQTFCEFYVSTLAGRTREQWAPLRSRTSARAAVPMRGAIISCMKASRSGCHWADVRPASVPI